jgi:curved DNA-binding protein
MAERDLYKVLGVPRTASEKEIRKAYRELARKYHPDRNPNDKAAEERFKDASYASEILLNSDKRKLYDEFGEIGLREGFNVDAFRQYQQRSKEGWGGGGGGRGFGGFGSLQDLLNQVGGARGGGGENPFEDLFGGDGVETIFGRGGSRNRNRRRDLVAEVTLEFADAIRGSEQEISLQAPGAAPRTLKVRIPSGVSEGENVRLRGQGADGGDLVLHVHVKEHPYFKREGHDLLLELPVTVGEAFRGAKVQVPTVEGSVSVKIPKGVRSGTKLRLRGKGVKHGSAVGDLLVEIQIVLPAGEGIGEAVDTIEAAYAGDVRKDIVL